MTDAPIDAIATELDTLADEFDMLGDPMDPERYRHLMDLGRQLEPLSDAERSEANKVRGCASQVWLVTEPRDGVLHFRGDSDSDIVRGLVAVLVRLFSGRPPQAILAFDIRAAFARLGFESAISAQRSNGFFSMVQRLRRDAEAMLGEV
jgi:cysteine desulfuration protein SufE